MLDNEWLKAFVPIGRIQNQQWSAIGAGVLFHLPPFIWVVTARHVVNLSEQLPVSVLITHKQQGIVPIPLTELHKQHALSWITDEEHDLAASLMPISNDFDIKAVTKDNCIKIGDLIPSMTAYTIGCPYGLRGFDPQSVTPVVLDGIVSGIDNRKKQIFTTTPTFRGNSGGPLLIVKSPFNAHGGATFGLPTIYLAGIMKELALIGVDEKSNHSQETIQVPPLHIGIATPSDFILNLLESDQAKAITKKIHIKN